MNALGVKKSETGLGKRQMRTLKKERSYRGLGIHGGEVKRQNGDDERGGGKTEQAWSRKNKR